MSDDCLHGWVFATVNWENRSIWWATDGGIGQWDGGGVTYTWEDLQRWGWSVWKCFVSEGEGGEDE